ncbi:MAG: hypothetical protein NTX49_01385 [Chlamydiae bacterium]|nr:hypothetical protein [Chlamydiota bacterium]
MEQDKETVSSMKAAMPWGWLLLSFPLLLIEIYLILWTGGLQHSVLFFSLCHLLICASFGPFIYRSYKRQLDTRFALILLLATLSTGPFGVAGWIFLCLIYPLLVKVSTPIGKWFSDLFPEGSITPFGQIYERITTGWDDYNQSAEVSSFEDIFSLGTLSQKQAVLDAIVKDFIPIYVPLLKRALTDSSNAIRIEAASIVVKIDFDFQEELIARHSQVWFSIAKALFHAAEYEEYISWYESYKNNFPIVPGILHSWHLESLYRTRRYEQFASSAKRF